MTNGRDGRERNGKPPYTLPWLPWLLSAVVFAVYLITLNRSLSFLSDWTSLLQQPPAGAKLAGWSFLPEMLAPVYHFVTLPLRLLQSWWQCLRLALPLHSLFPWVSRCCLALPLCSILPWERHWDLMNTARQPFWAIMLLGEVWEM